MKENNDIIINLINILEDNTSRIDEKDDALIDLGNFDDYYLLEILVRFASDKSNNPILLSSAGESISQILSRNKDFKINLSNLTPAAKAEIVIK